MRRAVERRCVGRVVVLVAVRRQATHHRFESGLFGIVEAPFILDGARRFGWRERALIAFGVIHALTRGKARALTKQVILLEIPTVLRGAQRYPVTVQSAAITDLDRARRLSRRGAPPCRP